MENPDPLLNTDVQSVKQEETESVVKTPQIVLSLISHSKNVASDQENKATPVSRLFLDVVHVKLGREYSVV